MVQPHCCFSSRLRRSARSATARSDTGMTLMTVTNGTPAGTLVRVPRRRPLSRFGTVGAAVVGACLMLPVGAQRSSAQTPSTQTSSAQGGRPDRHGAPRGTPKASAAGAPVTGTPLPGMRIVAVVSGDVITSGDVENRARLFALSTGLPTTPEVIDRLRTQIGNQLVDERLRLQEAQRRKVVIPDKQIAGAIHDIEQRNNMPDGAMRERLAALGVSVRTLIDQIRVQLAWTQVLREQLADKLNVTDAEIDEQMRLHQAQMGRPEYRVGEIFIPVDAPVNISDAQRFA